MGYILQYPYQTLPLATLSGVSGRTIERFFKAETGMTFRQCRSRFRLMNTMLLKFTLVVLHRSMR